MLCWTLCLWVWWEERGKKPGDVPACEMVGVWQWLPFSLFMTLTSVQALEGPTKGGWGGGGGGGGRKQKGGRKQSGDSEVRPVSFYGLLKKKRKRMNILPVLIDFCSSSPALPQGCLFSTLFSSNNGRSHTFAGSISPFLQGKNQQK